MRRAVILETDMPTTSTWAEEAALPLYPVVFLEDHVVLDVTIFEDRDMALRGAISWTGGLEAVDDRSPSLEDHVKEVVETLGYVVQHGPGDVQRYAKWIAAIADGLKEKAVWDDAGADPEYTDDHAELIARVLGTAEGMAETYEVSHHAKWVHALARALDPDQMIV